jgi:hypothetical protein
MADINFGSKGASPAAELRCRFSVSHSAVPTAVDRHLTSLLEVAADRALQAEEVSPARSAAKGGR